MKQATKGDKKLTIIYYMDYSPLSNIRQLNKMGVADSLLCRSSNYIKYVYTKKKCTYVLRASILLHSTIFVLDFGTVRQCGILCFSRFWNCSDSVVFFDFLDFGTVPTVVFLCFSRF